MAHDAETALHPSCTCRMGVDDDAVVDPDSLRVHGLEGLRVVDAAVMPSVTNANINAPVVMIAERGADMILGNDQLAPEPVALLPLPRRRTDQTTTGECGSLSGETPPYQLEPVTFRDVSLR